MPHVNVLTEIDFETFKQHRDNLMGCSQSKQNPSKITVYDNWVNRIVLGYPVYPKPMTHFVNTVEDKLKDFQVQDVSAMAKSSFYLNRNKMGSGKTIEFIANCITCRAESVIVVCPKPTIGQWIDKFKSWWPERADDVIAYDFKHEPTPGDILIVNPEKLISKKAVGKFNKFVWDIIGVDEAHMIKNRGSQRTIAIKLIPAKRRYPLTGTPVLRNPDDLYSIFDFMSPSIAGGSYWRFTEYFCHIEEDFYGRHSRGLTRNEEHVKILQEILRNLSCYHDIEVAQGKQQIVVPLLMDSKQKTLYNKIRKLLLAELPESITIPNGAVMLTRLLQTTSCPAVFEDDKVAQWGIKFEWLLDFLKTDPMMKVVVFSNYEKVVAQLKRFLSENKIRCATYTGKQAAEVKEANKQDFITNPYCQVLAGTIGAMGVGVDGLQNSGGYICVFIDKDTRPLINEQCEDRLHRDGQKKTVLCYYLECEKTVDQKISKVNLTRTSDLRKLLSEKV